MGKNKKKGPNANVFKVAGAKSLKKTKAKPVNLGLKNVKNMKQKVQEMDKEFVEINKTPKPSKAPIVPPKKKTEKKVSKEEVVKTAKNMEKMDL